MWFGGQHAPKFDGGGGSGGTDVAVDAPPCPPYLHQTNPARQLAPKSRAPSTTHSLAADFIYLDSPYPTSQAREPSE